MAVSRLTLALENGDVVLPDTGEIGVYHPVGDVDLSALPKDRVRIIQPFFPDYRAFEKQGYACSVAADGKFSMSVVRLPRSKDQARDLIANAAARSDYVIVDGQKNEGAESLLKECRKRADVSSVMSKAHGKLFVMQGGDFTDWVAEAQTTLECGFVTRCGVFSADGIDPASRLLADSLPEKLGRNVADLGGGWGYLSRAILERKSVETLWCVEANHDALECARLNVTDPRARFEWADATQWAARANMDSVVMNPPFHTSRTADPQIGRDFIAAAARMLAPSGQLWMVANRHLPYEATLDANFVQVAEVAGDNRFKILQASRPARPRR